jgi:hypothetical protein
MIDGVLPKFTTSIPQNKTIKTENAMSTQPRTPIYFWLRAITILILIGLLLPSGSAFAQDGTPPYRKGTTKTVTPTPLTQKSLQGAELDSGNLIQDGGFEAYTSPQYNDPYWQQYDNVAGTPLCSVWNACGYYELAYPHNGFAWGWFGGSWNNGTPVPNQTGYVSQDVYFPACGVGTLQFYLMIGDYPLSGGSNEKFWVTVDGKTMFTTNATQHSTYSSYKLVNINVGSFALGATHTIKFSHFNTDYPAEFNLDDVSLLANCGIYISGSAGTSGVTLIAQSNDPNMNQSVLSGSDGSYSIPIEYNWTGTVIPSKTGYTFTPASRTYSNVVANQTSQNYTAHPADAISGNAGVGGALLSYIDGTPKTALADGNGDYSLKVSYNWTGTVTPSQPCYTFSPVARPYANLLQDKAGENYTTTLVPDANCAFLNADVGGTPQGSYAVSPTGSQRYSYPGLDGGPLKAYSQDGTTQLLPSERFIYTFQNSKSYAEMIGYPDSQLTTEYWFPWYNNKSYSTQLRVSNMGGNSAEVKVYAGGNLVDTLTLNVGEARRISYTGLDAGPLHVVSTDGVTKILVSERFIQTYQTSASYSEMLGYPNNRLATEYWFPWYNNVSYSTQLRVTNLGSSGSAEIKVYAGSSLIDTFLLDAGQAKRISYAIDSGPLHVVSTDNVTPILASERFILTYGASASYAEMMGYPGDQLDTQYCFPLYNNRTDSGLTLSSQLRVSNMGTGSAEVNVYLAGNLLDTFTVDAALGRLVAYTSANNGPLCVVSTDGVTPILASERFISTYLSSAAYSELMGYPHSQMDHTWWFPWYNNNSYQTELRMAKP